jgi:hypothetical protein
LQETVPAVSFLGAVQMKQVRACGSHRSVAICASRQFVGQKPC